MPRFPQTARSVDALSAQVFSQLVAKAQQRGQAVAPLHVGDTWLEPLAAARAEAQLSATQPLLHNYSPVQGEPVLLDAILRHLQRRAGVKRDREQLQVMSGATAGLGVIIDALLDPGDEVIIPAPFWPLIRGTVRRRGAIAVEVPFFTKLGDEDFDPEAELEAAVTTNTAAIYVNTPHNPTGAMLGERELAAIARVAERHKLWIICDEVYEDLWFGEQAHASPWARPDFIDRTIAVHSLSKAYGLAGARVGFAHGPHAVMETIRGVQTFFTYCAPRPMQFGAAKALDEGQEWLANARKLYREAGYRSADALGIAPPAGGTFVFADAGPHLREGEDIMGFLQRCLDVDVLLTPGASLGDAYQDWVRVCFTSATPEVLSAALERLRPLFSR